MSTTATMTRLREPEPFTVESFEGPVWKAEVEEPKEIKESKGRTTSTTSSIIISAPTFEAATKAAGKFGEIKSIEAMKYYEFLAVYTEVEHEAPF